MDLQLAPEEVAFRDEVRTFIRDNLPPNTRDRMRLGYKPSKPEIIAWQRILNAKGWATFNWPREYGGPGWSAIQRMIFLEENLSAPAPELLSFNITMLGPVLIQFGTEEQKRRFLPRAANLDDWWCQGFSEPGAGSDLASLRTAAKRDGDHYVVNGQKIWTSTAHHADWCFCLVRTNPQAPKRQEGISFLLIDMKTPGVEVRPIISIDGSHHLNEVFFTDVRVPAENLVGEENKGWSVAKYLLGNERTGIARLGISKAAIRRTKEVAREVRMNGRPLIEDKAFRIRVAQLEVEAKALEIMQLRVVSAFEKSGGKKPDPLSSVLKIKGTELLQNSSELVMDVGGPQAMPVWQQELAALTNEPALAPDWAAQMAPAYLMLRAASIYGGTNEIQKNILNKAVLEL
ncbi:acyl-CoA dehydrogenase family protein [Belnapia moabensis]|uniref:acyl-CoA dehydrogenase family protein n=1 Tax=Belnapia moabensis TaxID=365533 RepID=UPI0005BAED23|nr:acyl-CoA dehydrogenase family protein [Belnapia moabensis]